MKKIHNVTVYQCSYCKRRFLSYKGANIHEKEYCKHKESPHQKGIIEKQNNCPHKLVDTHYSYIPGEAVKELTYDYCVDCEKIL